MKRYISVSQANTFQTCSYKYHLEYNLGLRKKQELTPMALGLAVHVGIEAGLSAYYNDQVLGNWGGGVGAAVSGALQDWSDENQPQDRMVPVVNADLSIGSALDHGFYRDWEIMIETAYQIVVRLFEHLDIPQNWEIMAANGEPLIEAWLETPIPGTEFIVRGKVDAVLRNRHTGLVHVIDWKTRDRFTQEDQEKLNMQLGIYQHMLRENYGLDAMVGVIYQISSKLPAKPSINKNNTVSRRKIATDWATYEETVREVGEDPRDYEDMRAALAEYEFFRPLEVVRNARITGKLWQNLEHMAERIQNTEAQFRHDPEAGFPKAYGYPCRNCVFAPICLADLHGWDVNGIIEEEYERREEHETTTESEL